VQVISVLERFFDGSTVWEAPFRPSIDI